MPFPLVDARLHFASSLPPPKRYPLPTWLYPIQACTHGNNPNTAANIRPRAHRPAYRTQIAFAARPDDNSRKEVWVVNVDGTGLRTVPIPGCGGSLLDPNSIGCDYPVWSPDGAKIAYARYSAKTHIKNIYTSNIDGTGMSQVTYNGLQDFSPSWGTHPTT